MIPQNLTEAILLGRLREPGAAAYRPYAVSELRQDGDGVTATLAANGQPPPSLRARYVVGADGMHSTVREQAGIGFTGAIYAQSFVLADVRMHWSPCLAGRLPRASSTTTSAPVGRSHSTSWR